MDSIESNAYIHLHKDNVKHYCEIDKDSINEIGEIKLLTTLEEMHKDLFETSIQDPLIKEWGNLLIQSASASTAEALKTLIKDSSIEDLSVLYEAIDKEMQKIVTGSLNYSMTKSLYEQAIKGDLSDTIQKSLQKVEKEMQNTAVSLDGIWQYIINLVKVIDEDDVEILKDVIKRGKEKDLKILRLSKNQKVANKRLIKLILKRINSIIKYVNKNKEQVKSGSSDTLQRQLTTILSQNLISKDLGEYVIGLRDKQAQNAVSYLVSGVGEQRYNSPGYKQLEKTLSFPFMQGGVTGKTDARIESENGISINISQNNGTQLNIIFDFSGVSNKLYLGEQSFFNKEAKSIPISNIESGSGGPIGPTINAIATEQKHIYAFFNTIRFFDPSSNEFQTAMRLLGTRQFLRLFSTTSFNGEGGFNFNKNLLDFSSYFYANGRVFSIREILYKIIDEAKNIENSMNYISYSLENMPPPIEKIGDDDNPLDAIIRSRNEIKQLKTIPRLYASLHIAKIFGK